MKVAEILAEIAAAQKDMGNGQRAVGHYRLERVALDLTANAELTDQALRAAFHALKSYEHGNGSPDLARATAAHIEVVLGGRVDAEG